MTLIDLINSGNYSSPQEALTALTTPSIEIKDQQLWTWAGIESLTDEKTADDLEKFLVDNGKTRWISQLGGTGLLLSDLKVQNMLINLVPLIPGCARLAEQGIRYQTPLQVAGLAIPTIEEIEAIFDLKEKQAIVSQCRDDMAALLQAIQAKSTALNAWLDSLDTTTKTVEEVQAYCNVLLASVDGNPTEVTP